MQFNILNKETLLAAQEDPEKYRSLIVRIAGYSAYFVDLSPDAAAGDHQSDGRAHVADALTMWRVELSRRPVDARPLAITIQKREKTCSSKTKSPSSPDQARGIGAGIADALAEEGAILIVMDRNMADAQLRGQRRLKPRAGRAMAVEGDVTNKATLDAMVVADPSRNTEGLTSSSTTPASKSVPMLLKDIPDAQWDRTLNVNLKGVFLCCQAVIPQMMKQNSGRIINIGSLAGRRMSFFGSADYTVSKWGLSGLAAHLAWELADSHITVNTICPGPDLDPSGRGRHDSRIPGDGGEALDSSRPLGDSDRHRRRRDLFCERRRRVGDGPVDGRRRRRHDRLRRGPATGRPRAHGRTSGETCRHEMNDRFLRSFDDWEQQRGRDENAEQTRLDQARDHKVEWKKWGPYLSERQWGTVREDYSEDGDAWNYFTHDQARSRAYRWGEDGLAGISDDKQRLCFALALWNGKDPILKERLFGLTNSEGNHGEDVKEYYFYLDSTPTHSYMKYLYKYPQAAFPYADLVETNRRRGRNEFEYELLDTGVFDDDRYFDVFVEYAKARRRTSSSDHRRQPRPGGGRRCTSCRRSGSATTGRGSPDPTGPRRSRRSGRSRRRQARVRSRQRIPCSVSSSLYCEGDVPLLFTENETNTRADLSGAAERERPT